MSILTKIYKDANNNIIHDTYFKLSKRKVTIDKWGNDSGICQLCKAENTRLYMETSDINIPDDAPDCKVEYFDFCDSCGDIIDEYDTTSMKWDEKDEDNPISNLYFIYRNKIYTGQTLRFRSK